MHFPTRRYWAHSLPSAIENHLSAVLEASTSGPLDRSVVEDVLDVTNGKAQSFLGTGSNALYKLEESANETTAYIKPFGLPQRAEQDLVLLSFEAASRLVCIYYDTIDWMYRPVQRELLERDLAVAFGFNPLPPLLRHEHARLLTVSALGTIFDCPVETLTHQDMYKLDQAKQQACRLFQRAASFLIQPTQHFLSCYSITTCETLHLMVSFLFVLGDAQAARLAWPLLGVSVRLSQGMGLHKDPYRWGLPDKEDVKRRAWSVGRS